jgi:hypothetical protein
VSAPEVSVTVFGLGGAPLRVLPIDGRPDLAVIHIGPPMRLSLHVSAEDIDWLSAGLEQAREVLKVSPSDQINKE